MSSRWKRNIYFITGAPFRKFNKFRSQDLLPNIQIIPGEGDEDIEEIIF